MATDNQNNNQKQNQNDYVFSVTDVPKDATQEDLLNSEGFTDGLIDYIEHADSPLSISLNGEWGSGKTSTMNTIKSKLCEGDNAKFYGIWVNTWQFSLLDSSSAPQAVIRILQSIVNQIITLKPDYGRREQISQLIGAIAMISSGLKSLSDVAGDPLFGVGKSTFGLAEKASNALSKFFNSKTNQSQPDNAALVKQLRDEIQKLVDEVLTVPNAKKTQEEYVQKYIPYNPFAISKISDCFCDKIVTFVYFCICNLFSMIGFVAYRLVLMVVNAVSAVGGAVWSIIMSLFSFCYYVIRVGYSICCKKEWPSKNNSKRQGFIFFIDDLDRIKPKTALEIIEMLANIFSFKRCVFIFAVDKNILTKAVKLKLNELDLNSDDMHCNQYLNKFINASANTPGVLYDTKPLLYKSLTNISFFTPEELNDEILGLLDRAVFWSVGKNPRSVKQLINNLTLINSIRRHTWNRDKDKPWQIKTITKIILFIIECVNLCCPEIIRALIMRPYFKIWNVDFVANDLLIENDQFNLELAYRCNATNDWERAVLYICNCDLESSAKFECAKRLLRIIDNLFDKYISKYHLNKSNEEDVYKKVMLDVFFYFYRISGVKDEHGLRSIQLVNTIKDNSKLY